jgi:hypothetical protein
MNFARQMQNNAFIFFFAKFFCESLIIFRYIGRMGPFVVASWIRCKLQVFQVPTLFSPCVCAKNNARDPPREKLYNSFRYTLPAIEKKAICYTGMTLVDKKLQYLKASSRIKTVKRGRSPRVSPSLSSHFLNVYYIVNKNKCPPEAIIFRLLDHK